MSKELPKPLEFIADHLPRDTLDDARRVSASGEIRDAWTFAAELPAFVHERVEAVELPSSLEMEPVEKTLTRKAAAPRAHTHECPARPTPAYRAVLQEAFNRQHNLSLPEFAGLANRWRLQSQKLPDWQPDPAKQY